MINVSNIPGNSILGKVLRGVLRAVPLPSTMWILQGPLRGTKWVRESGVAGYWLGTYEVPMQRAFLRVIKRGDVVFDIGAHVGFFTLLASRLVGKEGKVFAFEPSARNREALNKHLLLNKVTNVQVVPAAASSHTGKGNFLMEENSFTGRLVRGNGGIMTPVVGLDEEIAAGRLPIPDVVKIDVEGSERDIFQGMGRLLLTKHPIIIASLLPRDRDPLSAAGYRCRPLEGDLEEATEIIAQPVS